MPNIVIHPRAFDLAEWQGTPITEDEIRECLVKRLPPQKPEISRFLGRTSAGRVLLLFYKYQAGSDELTIYKAQDGPPPRDMAADLAEWEANFDKFR